MNQTALPSELCNTAIQEFAHRLARKVFGLPVTPEEIAADMIESVQKSMTNQPSNIAVVVTVSAEPQPPQLICSAAHRCHVEQCCHKKPHASRFGAHCGPAMTCHDSKIYCGCVPVTDGKYYTTRRDYCTCCGGRGYTDVTEEHHVPSAGASGSRTSP